MEKLQLRAAEARISAADAGFLFHNDATLPSRQIEIHPGSSQEIYSCSLALLYALRAKLPP
jgi:hypothetical protein